MSDTEKGSDAMVEEFETESWEENDYSSFRCYGCNVLGHIARHCPTVLWCGTSRGRVKGRRWDTDRRYFVPDERKYFSGRDFSSYYSPPYYGLPQVYPPYSPDTLGGTLLYPTANPHALSFAPARAEAMANPRETTTAGGHKGKTPNKELI